MIAAPIAPRFGHSRQEADIALRRAEGDVGARSTRLALIDEEITLGIVRAGADAVVEEVAGEGPRARCAESARLFALSCTAAGGRLGFPHP